MATITLEGNPIETCGELPTGKAPDFSLTGSDLSEKTLADYAGKTVVLNIFVSIETGICADSTKRFNEELNNLENTEVLCISNDLPFALDRFCGAEGLENVVPLSAFRSSFGEDYGVKITTGPIRGLLARSIVIINGDGEIIYSEQVPEIAQDPDFEAALSALK